MLIRFIRKLLISSHLNVVVYKIAKLFIRTEGLDFSADTVESARCLLNQYHENASTSSFANSHIQNIYDLHIIVPAYNVEKYIEACINSIITQKTDYSYFLTIINDGSIDNTRNLLTQYECIENVEIIDQENKGISAARNRGLERIKGRYVMFVDSDDTLTEGSIATLLDSAYRNDADIVQGAHYLINVKGKTIKAFPIIDTISDKANYYLRGFPWGKVFKSHLFENLHFPQGYWFEDTVFAYLIFPIAQSKVCVSNYVYNYRKNRAGISFSSQRQYNNIDSLYITEALIKDALHFPFSETDKFYSWQFQQIGCNYHRIASINNESINKAAFIIHCSLINQYFQGKTLTNGTYFRKEIEQAIKGHNYDLYKLANTLLF